MIISVTSRLLCKVDFLERIEQIAKARPYSIILREKDLLTGEYEKLAAECLEICSMYKVPLVINSNIEAARKLKIPDVHLTAELFRRYHNELGNFENIGVSVHSVEEAVCAEELGAGYLIAGHIFETDCKKGVAPRGLAFLKQVCEAVCIPVAAIGGITPLNAEEVLKAGASGICIMSQLMACEDAEGVIEGYRGLFNGKGICQGA